MIQENEPLHAIRDIVVKHARLGPSCAGLPPTANLYEAGLSSVSTIHILLALEEHFGVEFPDRLLGRKTFESIQSIAEAVASLRA